MIRTSFNNNWTVGPKAGFFSEVVASATAPKEITLPHDAMIWNKKLKPEEGGNVAIGFFPEGSYDYKKNFFVPLEYKDKRVTIEFEGVYMNAMVYINSEFAGQHPNGYTNFYVSADRFLKYGEENEIKVVAMNLRDSRWYSGAGIYRNTKLIIGNLVHIALDGIKIATPEINNERAVVTVATVLQNEGHNTRTLYVKTTIVDFGGYVIASEVSPITTFAGESATLRQRLYVRNPKLWSVDAPHLYQCRSSIVAEDGEELDKETNTFGIRSLTLNPDQGLCINGETVKLRGACIHHDNGVIGAATIDRAEERRVEILKEAGFNALRSSHHPMSKALLDACDRIGMLVVDESFDMWTTTKADHDYALHFPVWWEKDIQAMVDKNYNHPSVIMYTIGNEIPETGRRIDSAWGRKIVDKIRSLDSTRYITNAINFTVSVLDELSKWMKSQKSDQLEKSESSNEGINTMMNNLGEQMAMIVASDFAKEKTAESFACIDIAGYNYGEARYSMDMELFPNRIIVGSETKPEEIDRHWEMVKQHSQIIGDFTWTGWDYLGESGIGRVVYEPEELATGIVGGYPWFTAWCGDIDIIGNRRPVSYYREIVFGLRKTPFIAVQRPNHFGKQMFPMMWSWSDSISSWSWDGYEDKPIKVEVYSDAEEVELLVNGVSVGQTRAGKENRYKAEFETVYVPGEVEAIAYDNGEEIGRMKLRSAVNDVILKVKADRTVISASDNDLSFVMITLQDKQGNLYNTADRKVSVSVTGSGILQGCGSANPKSEENFFDGAYTTFDGKALAVIRPIGAGLIKVTVSAEGCASQTVQINAIALD
ncbi:glycoside hydrolase family 2 TIM barrel-domain containing protein [Paenibacillus sp. OK003]|uniref:glycoside hydrolase family 2 TIM barrel-domain containing protein n=1 Tax=Paenibacillus sp. OK003 TaxID=1884380 RepID=UPI0008C2BFFA|nr:glycoside hydrolase family 2 TIM barrel-domain containing protein [Paenibacillus sp. OK003]SEK62012.1 beta-galactosidase [Paenibacillus sp. OK003]